MLDEMRMSAACFARAPQRWTSRLSKHLLLTFQEVTPLSKTRNQLIAKGGVSREHEHKLQQMGDKLVLRFLGLLETIQYTLEQSHGVPPLSVA